MVHVPVGSGGASAGHGSTGAAVSGRGQRPGIVPLSAIPRPSVLICKKEATDQTKRKRLALSFVLAFGTLEASGFLTSVFHLYSPPEALAKRSDIPTGLSDQMKCPDAGQMLISPVYIVGMPPAPLPCRRTPQYRHRFAAAIIKLGLRKGIEILITIPQLRPLFRFGTDETRFPHSDNFTFCT